MINDKIAEIGERITDQRVLSYGFDKEAVVSAHNLAYSFSGERQLKNLTGMSFKIKYQEAYIPVLLNGALSKPAVYAALAAASVGFAYGLNGIEVSEALQSFETAKGRMKLIEGINGAMIIDDSYNASTQATISALETIEAFDLPEIKRHWLVLGDMLELGEDSKAEHTEVGEKAAELKNVRLVVLGQESLYISVAARKGGLSEKHIYHCNNHQEIIDLLTKELKDGDLVLVKGSQGMRMEKVVAGIMLEPERANEMLVRQGKDWENKY
jgi:UDP-N-acetylmuramoyl-tripeptide--D-alanyl-D-alanine ligase